MHPGWQEFTDHLRIWLYLEKRLLAALNNPSRSKQPAGFLAD